MRHCLNYLSSTPPLPRQKRSLWRSVRLRRDIFRPYPFNRRFRHYPGQRSTSLTGTSTPAAGSLVGFEPCDDCVPVPAMVITQQHRRRTREPSPEENDWGRASRVGWRTCYDEGKCRGDARTMDTPVSSPDRSIFGNPTGFTMLGWPRWC